MSVGTLPAMYQVTEALWSRQAVPDQGKDESLFWPNKALVQTL